MTDEEIQELGNRIQDTVRPISSVARVNVSWKDMGVRGLIISVTLGVRGSPLEDIATMQLGAQAELMLVPCGVAWTLCVAQV